MAYRRDVTTSLTLTPEQQAEVTGLIVAAGLDAGEFTWAVQRSEYCLLGTLVSAFIHTPTSYAFRFEVLETARGHTYQAS